MHEAWALSAVGITKYHRSVSTGIILVPVKATVAELEEAVLDTIDSFNIIGGMATQLREDIAAAGYTPTTPPRQLAENPPEELLTPSFRRRLLRRQAKKNWVILLVTSRLVGFIGLLAIDHVNWLAC
ncbi:hypothetical protein ACP70R_003740 [Stipagrostis hirtigluma subsp. patula]